MTRLLGPTGNPQHLKHCLVKEFQCSSAKVPLNSVYTISTSYVVATVRVLDLDRWRNPHIRK